MNTPETKQMVDTAGAARVMGISMQMVRLLARAGRIKAYHPAGCRKYVFDVQELKAAMIPAEER